MARKIVDVTDSASLYDILSQTPKNFSDKNYFLKELQDKVDAEWRYRPNRVDVEYESQRGTILGQKQEWQPLEVVIQTNKTQKGEAVADDNKNIVFKNIFEDRFKLGSKFRFAPNFSLKALDKQKNVWLGVNMDKTSMTANLIIQRCNGVLGSTYVDTQGVSHYHYEPVIQNKDLSSTNFSYSEVAVSPQARLTIIAQYNDFTSKYYINQRFIIGAREEDENNLGHYKGGQVYRITAIDKDYSLSTWDPENVGLIKIYTELTESSVYDKWDELIAYQNTAEVHLETKPEAEGYSISFETPEKIPTELYADELVFTPILVNNNGEKQEEASSYIKTEYFLENWPTNRSKEDQANYINFIENSNGSFVLSRKKIYMNGDLVIVCSIPKEYSPTGVEIEASFKLVVRNQE